VGRAFCGGTIVSRGASSATVSLMRIALGIDMAVVFFGLLAVRGLAVFDQWIVWTGGGIALVWLLVALGTIGTGVGKWLGHIFHLALLGAFAIDVAIGASVLVPIGFWVFAIIRGPQLDAMAAEADGQDS
jgi:hypothetical protein